MQKKWAKIIGLLVILGYLVFAIFVFAYRGERQVCKAVDISVEDSARLRFITDKEIIRFLEHKELNPIGLNMEKIQTDKIEKALEKQPRIKKAECYKTPSGTVNIVVVQREPILRVMNSGRNYYVDKEGEIMPVSSNFTAYVPVVTGAVTEQLAKGVLYDFALFLKRNKFWNAQIEQIYIDYNEDVELIPRVGNHTILLGRLENYEYKLNKLLSVYKNGFNRTGWNCYRQINLKYENQVICTKK